MVMNMLRSSFRRPSDGAFQRLEENNPSDEKKVLFLSVEGANTERHYFECLKILMGKSGDFTFHIEVLKREGSEGYSAPKYVIELLEEYMDVRDHGPLSEDWMRRIEAEYSPKTLKQLLEKNHGSELTPEEKCICEGLLDEGLDLIYRRYLSKMGSRKGDIYVAVIDRESSNNRREALLRYIQNCGNKEYKLYYDDFLNTKEIKINDQTLITNNYEEKNGNLVSSIYGNNHITTFDYDDFDRLTVLTKMDDAYNYKYDNHGNLGAVISNNSNIRYRYDLSKRLVDYRTNNFSIRYTYGKNDNVSRKEYRLWEMNYSLENTFNRDDQLVKTVYPYIGEINYNYDYLGRLQNQNINNLINTDYEYVTNGKRTSLLIESLKTNDDKYTYKYDKLSNITHIYLNDELINKYYYDEYNQLVGEKNYLTNERIKYIYDDSGNILTKRAIELTTHNFIKEDVYEYNNKNNWEDQLTKFNNDNIIYDEIGNPTTIGQNTLTWINGRQLNSYSNNNQNITYKYNESGIRTSKIIDGITTNYHLEDTDIIYEVRDNQIINYLYDINGVAGMQVNNDRYYFIKNIQNDIIGIVDEENQLVGRYTYDSWGQITSIEAINNSNIVNINPFRYRGYYYDIETNLYYLNSRYYNPVWGRFLNVDKLVGANQDLMSYNLYAYVSNSPITKIDFNGDFAIFLPLIKPATKVFIVGATAVAGWLATPQGRTTTSNVAQEVARPIRDVRAFTASQLSGTRSLDTPQSKVSRPPTSQHLHHIVAQTDMRAQGSRDILHHVGLTGGVNNPLNLVSLDASFHSGMHTNEYHRRVNTKLSIAYAWADGCSVTQLKNVKFVLLYLSADLQMKNALYMQK